jgi:hypothetical protein
MKAAIIGSRSISDALALEKLLEPHRDRITEVISGGATGVDTLADSWAKQHGKALTVIRPDYERHGRAAPLIRNRQIVKEAEEVFILWDGRSKGTANTRKEAVRRGKPIYEQLTKPD